MLVQKDLATRGVTVPLRRSNVTNVINQGIISIDNRFEDAWNRRTAERERAEEEESSKRKTFEEESSKATTSSEDKRRRHDDSSTRNNERHKRVREQETKDDTSLGSKTQKSSRTGEGSSKTKTTSKTGEGFRAS